jgi:C-terminal processing protease CtpA/Prc
MWTIALLVAITRTPPVRQTQGWLGLGFTCHARDKSARCESLVVLAVAPKGPSDRAGLRAHDIIVRVNGAPARFVSNADTLDAFRRVKRGDVVMLDVVRAGQPLRISVHAESLPPEFAARWPVNDTLAREKDRPRGSRPPR